MSSREDTWIDPRIRRTRRMLEDAVLSLAECRDFDSITVRDITERADLNRATFYLHYQDKEDLCAQALDGLFKELTGETQASLATRDHVILKSIPVGITSMLRHCAERPELFRRLLAETGSSGFAVRLRQYFEAGFLRVWSDMEIEVAPGSPPARMRARAAAASMQGVILWWLEDGEGVSLDEAAQWTWSILQPLWFEDSSLGEPRAI